MTGVMPCCAACQWNSAAPNRLPWSVIATCVMPRWLTSLKRSFSRAAPSSIEYSVWTCRWAYGAVVVPALAAPLAAADDAMDPTASSGTLRAARALCSPASGALARRVFNRRPGEGGRHPDHGRGPASHGGPVRVAAVMRQPGDCHLIGSG